MPTPLELAKRYYLEAVNLAKYEVLDEIVDAQAVIHTVRGDAVGPQGAAAGIRNIKSGFSNAAVTIEDTIAQGDKVALRLRLTGTHDGVFAGIPASGKEMEQRPFVVFNTANGKIVEQWTQVDRLAVLEQLGASLRTPA